MCMMRKRRWSMPRAGPILAAPAALLHAARFEAAEARVGHDGGRGAGGHADDAPHRERLAGGVVAAADPGAHLGLLAGPERDRVVAAVGDRPLLRAGVLNHPPARDEQGGAD